MKKVAALILSIFVFALLGSAAIAAYPEKPLKGIIMWGAGGGTDNFARAITPIAEKILGQSIILQNKPGATGAIATTMVVNAPADGYTLLYGAENPALYRVLDLSPLSFHDLEPIIIGVDGAGVVCVNPDNPYHKMEDLINAAKRGEKIKMATTGTGGLPYVLGAMMRNIHGVEFTTIQFDGEGPGAVAVMGGHADAMPMALSTAVEGIRAGKLRGLAVLRTQRVPQLPDVPAITEIYPEYNRYLPWGPFYGVFVKKGTPEPIVKKLSSAFKKASEDPRFVQYVENTGGFINGATGEEAVRFLNKFESVTTWLVYEAGGAKKSPEEFNIPKP